MNLEELSSLTPDEYIDLAARGCCQTGLLGDWPGLMRALREIGLGLPPDVPAHTVMRICKLIMVVGVEAATNSWRLPNKKTFTGNGSFTAE